MVAIAVTAWLGPKAIALATKVLAGPAATAAAASAGTAIGGSAAFGGAVIGGAVAGAAGSAVSQGVGIATGIQERFNWGAVGMAAIAGGIAGGLNAGDGGSPMIRGIKSEFLSNFVNGAAQAAIGGVLSQGLGVVTGLQKKFDWAGVAAGVIGGGLSAGVGGGRFVAPTVDSVVSAAARSLITGTSFGDNLVAVLPSVIGRTIGGMVGQAIARSGDESRALKSDAGSSPIQSSTSPDDLPPIDGIQGGDEILVTARRSNGVLLVSEGYSPLSMMTNVLYDSAGFLPSDASVLNWAKPRTSLLTRLLDPSNLKWLRRGSGIGTVGELIFGASPAGEKVQIPLFGENATLEYTAPNRFDGYSIISNDYNVGGAPQTDLENVFLIMAPNGELGTISGNNAVVMRTIDVGGEQIGVGFGVSIQSRREGEIYNEGVANGWSNDKINNAIAAERNAPVDGGGDFRLSDMRSVPGKAFNSGTLADADSSWLLGGSGAVPAQVAAALNGQKFDSFDAFRGAFWKTVANTPELAAGFTPQNLGRMQAGNAPRAFRGDWLGKQSTFQIHHPEQIRYGGAVYDMSNMIVVTPRIHNDLHNGPKR